MSAPLRVGAVLHGFCGGAFGRDVFGELRVEAIGADWVIVRDEGSGTPVFASGDPDRLVEYLIKESEGE